MADPQPRLTPEQIRDAAFSQIAIASVAYAEQRIALVRMLAAGRDHGLTVPELADAAGRPVSLILELLLEEG